jgi:hypothetical protein
MEEVIEHWYEIPLYKLIELIGNNRIPCSIIHLAPWTNFNLDYKYYSHNNSITPVVSSIDNIFTIKYQSRVEYTLETYLQLSNSHLHPNAKLRFKKNILEEINNFIPLSK